MGIRNPEFRVSNFNGMAEVDETQQTQKMQEEPDVDDNSPSVHSILM